MYPLTTPFTEVSIAKARISNLRPDTSKGLSMYFYTIDVRLPVAELKFLIRLLISDNYCAT